MKAKLKQYYEQSLLLESLQESVQTLKESLAMLQGEIISVAGGTQFIASAFPSVAMNCDPPASLFAMKGSWARKGMEGQYLFSVELAARLVRFGKKDELDMEDQKWLESVSADLGSAYVRRRLMLNKRAIQGAMANGEIDEAALKAVKLRYVAEPSLSVKRLASKEDAEALLDEVAELVGDSDE